MRGKMAKLNASQEQRKHAEEALRYRAEFESVITSISTNFLTLAHDQFDQGIMQALERIGEFDGVDRSYVFLFSEDGKKMDNTHEWCAKGITPQIANLKGILVDEELPWFAKKIKNLEVFHVPKVAELPAEAKAERDHFRMQEIQSLIVVPMVFREKLIGFLGFDSVRKKKTWSESIIALLKIVGEIFTNALEHKRAGEALRKSEETALRLAQENAIMAEIGRIISSTLNIEEVYERFAREANKLIPSDRIAINIINREEGTITNAYVSGIEVADRRPGDVILLAGSLNEKIIQARKSLLIQAEDPEELARHFPTLLTTFRAGLRSMMSVPLVSQDQVVGVLHFRSTRPNAYTEEDIKLAESVAAQIAGAIANAQLFLQRRQAELALQKRREEANRLAQENAFMAEIGQIISSTLNVEEVYEWFVETVRKLIPFDRIAINVINHQDRTFTIPYVHGPAVAGRKVGDVIPLAGTGAQWVMQHRSSMLILEENWEEVIGRFPGLRPLLKAGFRSAMLIPLISKDQVIAVLNLQTFKKNAYTQVDLKLAERVGTQIAGAIANALLFLEHKQTEEVLRQAEERYRLLFEISTNAVLIRDQEGIIRLANPTAINMLKASRPDEIIGKAYLDFVHPEDRPGSIDRIQGQIKAAQGEPGIDPAHIAVPLREHRLLTLDGETIYVESTGIAFPYQRQVWIQGIFHDITKRKQAEAALRKSEEVARRMAHENGIVAEIGRIISSTLNIEDIYERFAEETRKLIFFDYIAITIVNQEKGTFHNAYISGDAVPGRRHMEVVSLAGSFTEEVMRSRSIQLIQTQNADEVATRFPKLLPFCQRGFRSFMAVPLISNDQVIGVLHVYSIRSNAFKDADMNLAERIAGQIAGAIANAQLFAQRKRAEEALRRSEEEAKRLAKEAAVLAEIGRIISSTLDIQEVYESFAQEALKLIPFDRISINLINLEEGIAVVSYVAGLDVPGRRFGDTYLLKDSVTEKIRGNRLSLLIQPETREDLEENFPKFMPHFQAGLRSMMTIPLISRDAVIGILHLQSTKIKAYTDQDLRLAERIASQIAGAIANAQLFAERRRTEEALHASEEKYRLLIQHSNDAIFIAQDGVIKFPNPKTEDLLEYSAPELARIPFVNHIHPDDRDIVLEKHKKRLEGQKFPSTYPFRVINRSGRQLWVEINAVLIEWEGRPATLNFIRDISEKKKLEAQFLQAQKMEAVGTLAGGIAHDFNNLLMGIQGHTSLMLLDMDPSHRHYKMLKSMEEQVKSGADLTWQLLSFARGGKYEVKPTDLNTIVIKTSDMFGRTKKEISIHKSLQQGLWPVEVDRGQIEQVLVNLYVNSWQAMPSGGSLFLETKNVILDEDYVRPLNARPGNYVKISVTDTGVGMDEKTLKRIFEPFFTTKDMGRGTGLGLATVYGIIKSHEGFINAYSEKGHGATFNIYLPASEKEVEREKKSPELLLKGKETILVVDDEEVIINVSRMILEALGYKVFMAQSGQQAIEVYKDNKEQIDLVVLDMIMPAMGGENTFEVLKTINPDVKVILSSGYSINGQATRIMERGCQGFIQKPFGARELSQKVREVLDNNLNNVREKAESNKSIV